ncbi:hypothetical protein O181_039996 [Austropuccinia psidii MF-1]|uniref:Uncharacterized protein n=1 Tax=Austropuccinia psidii MF-1 TaxID=1389203 RepID=A0A9Q3DAL5_9BASI|nr:hypothetical protein [Austropuccinia psidii MF-1]
MNFYKRGLESILLGQLDSQTGNFDSHQELMDISLKLDTRYHERQKEKCGNQEKKPPVSSSSFFRPPHNPSIMNPHQKEKKAKNLQVLKDKPHYFLLNKDKSLIGSENDKHLKQALCTYFGGYYRIAKLFNRTGPSSGFPRKQGRS